MSAPGSKPASADRAGQFGERLLVRLEGRPVAAFVGDAVQRAALREARAGRLVDLARSTPALSAKLPAPVQMIMKSCTSMRPCACAPPPKIWICGTGIATARLPARNFHSGFFAAAAAACAQASDTATMALPPRRDLSGVPSSAISS